jgi:nicotinamide-nucleotide amidase
MDGSARASSGRPTRLRLVLIGDELLDGMVQDRHLQYLARALDGLGLSFEDARLVRDRPEAIAALVEDPGWSITVSTGGLGPTVDDCTRQALAAAFGAELVFDEQRWMELKAWFRERGRVAGKLQRSQALHPRPGFHFRNEVGTADGLGFERDGRVWVALPGVPSELRHLLETGLLPWLRSRLGAADQATRLAFRTRGLPEADLHARLEPLTELAALGRIGFYPSPDGVLLRLTLPPLPPRDLEARREAVRAFVLPRLGDRLLVESGEPVVRLVLDELRRREQTLALAESCTGGGLAMLLTDFPGASEVFPGGVVSYANEAKVELLGVPETLLAAHGAVSAPCVRAMATGARTRLGSDWALAVSGIAGPGGGTPDKPVGTVWLGLAGPGGLVRDERLNLRGSRDQIRSRAAGQAWAGLYAALLESASEKG